ncbi:MAG: hypothetical protein M1833_004712 [Piccolia ochrophora]|nr:MAG: hypothetical protein M1833_004712 [Piccolia ochrophora]
MLRNSLNFTLSFAQHQCVPVFVLRRHTSTWSDESHGPDEQELAEARQWLANFKKESIPRSIYELKHSRSSGAGGQHVNRTNSKAEIRVPMQKLMPLLPSLLHARLRAHRYYASGSDSIIIQAQSSRKQAQNDRDCLDKLFDAIVGAAKSVIPGETSAEQKRRAQNLRKAEDEARLRGKKAHTAKKVARRGGSSVD